MQRYGHTKKWQCVFDSFFFWSMLLRIWLDMWLPGTTRKTNNSFCHWRSWQNVLGLEKDPPEGISSHTPSALPNWRSLCSAAVFWFDFTLLLLSPKRLVWKQKPCPALNFNWERNAILHLSPSSQMPFSPWDSNPVSETRTGAFQWRAR